MRVAFFLSLNETGGALNQTKGFLNKISKIKSNHDFFLIINNKTNYDELAFKNIKLLYFKKNFILKIIFFLIGFISNNKFFSIKITNPFERFLKKNKIDFVIFSNPSFFSNYCENTDYAINIWNTEISNYAFFNEFKNGNYEFQNKIIKKSVRDAFRIIVFTEQNKKDLIDLYNCNRDKIVTQNLTPVLPEKYENQKDFDFKSIYQKFNFDYDKDWFFYPAQFWSHKNHIYLLKTLEIIQRNNHRISFIFCGGDKGNLDYIKNLVKKLQLENNIRILGHINEQELISIYKFCAGVVIPTYLGRSSLPLLEAIYFKKRIYYSKNILDESLKKYVTEFDLNDPTDLVAKLKNFSSEKFDNNINYQNLFSTNSFEEKYLKIINDYSFYLNTWKDD